MASPKQQTFAVGPFRRVRVTPDPYDDAGPDTLASVTNCYLADAQHGGGLYARPGTVRWGPISSASSAQCVYCHTATDGTRYNFFIVGGVLYRQSTDLSTTPVDVSPVGITINTTGRVYITSLNDSIIVNDGVNEPWIGTNLGATPITGAYIDYDGAGVAWSAFGQPVVYTGAVFFILNTVNSVAARTTIAWSEPNQPATGYQQTNYDNAWTLTQTSSSPLYALAATNDALYYARQYSWGAITGAPNINFQNTATHDVVSGNVGCIAPATVRTFLNYVYFADQNGRPCRFAVGGVPEPIWTQALSFFSGTNSVNPSIVASTWMGCIEPNLNVYLLGTGVSTAGASSWHVFDAMAGIYCGFWTFGAAATATASGLMANTNGLMQLVVVAASASSEVYPSKLALVGDNVWTDNGATTSISVVTGRFGYNARKSYTTVAARVIAFYNGAQPAINITYSTSQQTTSAAAMGSLASSPTTIYLLTHQPSQLIGRDVRVTLTPTATAQQLYIFRIEVDVVEQGDSPITDW